MEPPDLSGRHRSCCRLVSLRRRISRGCRDRRPRIYPHVRRLRGHYSLLLPSLRGIRFSRIPPAGAPFDRDGREFNPVRGGLVFYRTLDARGPGIPPAMLRGEERDGGAEGNPHFDHLLVSVRLHDGDRGTLCTGCDPEPARTDDGVSRACRGDPAPGCERDVLCGDACDHHVDAQYARIRISPDAREGHPPAAGSQHIGEFTGARKVDALYAARTDHRVHPFCDYSAGDPERDPDLVHDRDRHYPGTARSPDGKLLRLPEDSAALRVLGDGRRMADLHRLADLGHRPGRWRISPRD